MGVTAVLRGGGGGQPLPTPRDASRSRKGAIYLPRSVVERGRRENEAWYFLWSVLRLRSEKRGRVRLSLDISRRRSPHSKERGPRFAMAGAARFSLRFWDFFWKRRSRPEQVADSVAAGDSFRELKGKKKKKKNSFRYRMPSSVGGCGKERRGRKASPRTAPAMACRARQTQGEAAQLPGFRP